MKFGRVFFSIFLFLFVYNSAFASTLNNLNVAVSSDGTVPSVSVPCISGHNYTLTLTHQENDIVSHTVGSIQRKYCDGSFTTFSSFNLNTLLGALDPLWWNSIYTPLEYIIKDTTGLGANIICNATSCPVLNEYGDFNSYNRDVQLASSTYWTTVGAGPIFVTLNNVDWQNSGNGDGSGNYVAPPSNSNILFIPGFEASKLYKTGVLECSVNCEDELWEPNANSDAEALFLDLNGKSLDDSIYTRDVMGEAYGTLNIYKSFLDKLQEMKSADSTIADYSAVPYDWRLSLEDILRAGEKDGNGNIFYAHATSSPYIIKELQRLVDGSRSGKVTIVAHSNGGLVAKALLQKLADTNSPLLAKVDKLILVAVPQLGTPAAIPALLHGYSQSIPASFAPLFLSSKTARQFGVNMPGAYNLLPSSNYFTYVDNPVVTFDISLADWSSQYGESIHSNELLSAFLSGSYGKTIEAQDTDTPIALSSQLLADAEAEHIVLDNWRPPSTMQVIEIAGWGVPTTISGIKYVKVKDKVKPEPIFTIDGDGTVVTPSALWGNGWASTTRYWVDLDSYNVFLARHSDHKSILEVPEVSSLINNLVVSTSNPVLTNYIFTSKPQSGPNDNRLMYSLHSPLTLDIYDNFGRHTGVSTTTNKIENQIPGTYFVQFGEEKYIFTNADSPSNIVMSGYDTGTFTFIISEMQGDNTVSTITFQDIPTNSNTKVSMNVLNGISSASPLLVDFNGDGSVDINLLPIVGGVVTYLRPVSTELAIVAPLGGNGPILQTQVIQGSISTPIMNIPTSSLATSTTALKKFDQKVGSTTVKVSSTVSVTRLVIKKKATQLEAMSSQAAQVISSVSIKKFSFVSLFRDAVDWIVDKFR